MPILIRNTSMEPCTLPYPFQGVMASGQRIIISQASRSEALTAAPSLATGFEVIDMPGYTGTNDDATYGLVSSIFPTAILSGLGGSEMIAIDGTSLGFYGATPVAQAATIAALGATPTLTGAATIDLTVLGTHLTSIRTELNAIRTVLIDLGLVAAS